ATVTFATQRTEMPGDTDSRDNDELRSVTYFYDLELDKDGNILAGYWYQDVHPDLLWRPEPGHMVSTWGDGFVRGNWSYDQGELPWSWKKGGEYDARSGKPLGKFVHALFEAADASTPSNATSRLSGYGFDGFASCQPGHQCPAMAEGDPLVTACYKLGARVYTCDDCRYLCSQP